MNEIEKYYKSNNILFEQKEISEEINRLTKEGYKPFRKILKMVKGELSIEYKPTTFNLIYFNSNFNVMENGGTGIFFRKNGFKEIYFGLDAKVDGKSYIILKI